MSDQGDRSRSPRGDALFGWDNESDSGDTDVDDSRTQHEFGNQLEEFLLQKFAVGDMDAQTVCVISWYATQAGAFGDGLARLAYPPDKSTGNYMKHLRKLVPVDISDL